MGNVDQNMKESMEETETLETILEAIDNASRNNNIHIQGLVEEAEGYIYSNIYMICL